jgi:hypothetical protein
VYNVVVSSPLLCMIFFRDNMVPQINNECRTE